MTAAWFLVALDWTKPAPTVSYPVDTRGLFPSRIQSLGSEADSFPPDSTEPKNAWIYSNISP
jgi:hypothetical protein